MPEIKHNFTGGKMNKDLDERLIPNGQYRDAMNIQVSTSEGSDVGTIQNILGNSLVPGQGFITNGSICVGSIADEKNDKLYYFIKDAGEEMIQNGALIDNTHWSSTGGNGITEDYGGDGVLLSADSSILTHQYAGFYQIFQLKHGKEYSFEVEFDETDEVGDTELMRYIIMGAGATSGLPGEGDGLYRPLWENPAEHPSGYAAETSPQHPHIEDGVHKHTFVFDQTQNNGSQAMTFYVQMTNGDEVNKSVRLKYASLIETGGDIIVEYDSKANLITPVLVDLDGDVLKFDPNRLITGINIVDDMLFWTDNFSEPKKINIPRCIEGTDPVGTVHTKLVNEAQDIDLTNNTTDIKEEHITVIKKPPRTSPTIKVLSERDPNFTHTGVMQIIHNPGSLSPGTANTANTSSLWVNNNHALNHLFDFSTLGIGSQFVTNIETDINGESGFTLDWDVGDTLLFKEFGGSNYTDAPSVPITDYTMKCKIISSSLNTFTDEVTNLIANGDFSIPNTTGDGPANLSLDDTAEYNALSSNIIFNEAITTEHPGFRSFPTVPFVTDTAASGNAGTYRLTIEISNYVSGVVQFVIYDNDDSLANIGINSGGGYSRHWRLNGWSGISSDGIHTVDITLDENTGDTGWSNATGANHGKFRVYGHAHPVELTVESISIERLDATDAAVKLEVVAIEGALISPPETEQSLRYAVDKLDEQEKLFEFKFPRFAYRYKYTDNEYSTISPFSEIAFLPGAFDYHPKKGYNLGMSNRITEVEIEGFVSDVPKDVVSIDLLYKEDASTNIYIIDTITPKQTATGASGSNIWTDNAFKIKSEQIRQLLPSNQILRSWDAVPKKALAQDVSGSRLIYGNYVQNYDLKYGTEDYYPDISFNFNSIQNNALDTVKSIKSLREYQLGVVFVDEYGRETPVITNSTGGAKLDKVDAGKINKAQVSFNNDKYPDGMKYMKFFIKETSGEYYNMAMDRYFEAGDGHVWLSFPSSDRNKVDEETFLILKKGIESNVSIQDPARYKVLAIENNAPNYIKQKRDLISESIHDFDESNGINIFSNNIVNAPVSGRKTFKMKYDGLSGSTSQNIHEVQDGVLYIEFGFQGSDAKSERYKITNVTSDFDGANIADANFTVVLDKVLGNDVDFITKDPTGANVNKIEDGTIVNIYKYKIEDSAEFDGRFFVKILRDEIFSQYIVENDVVLGSNYRLLTAKKLYYLPSQTGLNSLNSSAKTGQSHGKYSGNFGRWACYFRDYNKEKTFKLYSLYTSSFTLHSAGITTNVGQYVFNEYVDPIFSPNGQVKAWMWELNLITSYKKFWPGHIWTGFGGESHGTLAFGQGNNGMYLERDIDKKIGEHNLYTASEWDGVYNDNPNSNMLGQQEKGGVWFVDGGDYAGKNPTNNLTPASYNTTSGSKNGWEVLGITSSLSIGIGNIISPTYMDDDNYTAPSSGTFTNSGNIQNFFSVGNNDQYPNNYSNRILVENIKDGSRVRFREDPNKTIYEVVNTSIDNLINYDSDQSPWEETGWGGYPPHAGATNYYQTSSQQHNRKYHSNNTDFVGQLGPNFRKTWTLELKNLTEGSNPETIAWDPTGSGGTGPISGGVSITKAHSTTFALPANDHEYTVVVDDIIGTDATTGESMAITVGMMITSYNNAAVSLNNTTDDLDPLIIKKIVDAGGHYVLHLCGYNRLLVETTAGQWTQHKVHVTAFTAGQNIVFQQPSANGYSSYSARRVSAQYGTPYSADNPGIWAVGYNLEIIEPVVISGLESGNPAIWETEPKESVDVDIYYEASDLIPLQMSYDTRTTLIPLGSTVIHIGSNLIPPGTKIWFWTGDPNIIDNPTQPTGQVWFYHVDSAGNWATAYIPMGSGYVNVGDQLEITRPNGSTIRVTVSYVPATTAGDTSYWLNINSVMHNPDTTHNLNWYNCFSFGNGVESNRIRDNYNLPFIANGVKVSTTLEGDYNEERRKYGLIYSGIYNSNVGINNLNQFVAAEKITKDINPIYGSIQKLHARDTDLVTLCEDKVLKILIDKDALFNADGSPQLLAQKSILGQSVPFVGEYGISKDPASFASEAYRAYFTDRVRGTVMRLSRDGLTAISNHGMKDWFRDNLSLGITNLLGENPLAGSYNANGNQSEWDSMSNAVIANNELHIGYYNQFIATDDMAFQIANVRKNDILEIGKTYQVRFDVVAVYPTIVDGHTYVDETTGGLRDVFITNHSTEHSFDGNYIGIPSSDSPGMHVKKTFVANRTSFVIGGTWQINDEAYYYDDGAAGDTISVQEWMGQTHRGEDGTGVPYTYPNLPWIYGIEVKIKNIVLEEVKVDQSKIIGSYDDRQDEYNVTLLPAANGNNVTATFREDVKGWVSFKTFTPENAISCANDYYTMKFGKLYQHHIPGADRNTFYKDRSLLSFQPSSLTVVLNQSPESVKSFHTLDYEGSDSRVEGIRHITAKSVTWTGAGTQPDGKYVMDFDPIEIDKLLNVKNWGLNTGGPNGWEFEGKQYRNNILIYSGDFIAFDNTNGVHLRRDNPPGVEGDFQVGDIITTQQQEETVNPFNAEPRDGWHVDTIKTNKQEGTLPEFVEKEGKWFNYIKGIGWNQWDTGVLSDLDEDTDFGSSNIQGIGIVQGVTGPELTFEKEINTSLSFGDSMYFESPSVALGDELVNMLNYSPVSDGGFPTAIGFTVISESTVSWDGSIAVGGFGTTPNSYDYIWNIAQPMVANEEYRLRLEISNYSGSGDVGVSNSAGVGFGARLSGDGFVEIDFISNGERPDIFGYETNSATINVSIKQHIPSSVLAFNRIDVNNIQKFGIVDTVDNLGNSIMMHPDHMLTAQPVKGDYIFFSKNPTTNISSLVGYYAQATFKNNSKVKAELYSIGSEVSESSK